MVIPSRAARLIKVAVHRNDCKRRSRGKLIAHSSSCPVSQAGQ